MAKLRILRPRFRRKKKRPYTISRGLRELVYLGLALFVYDKILNSTLPMIENSTWFATVFTFVKPLVPIAGIIWGASVVIRMVRSLRA